MSFCLLIYIPHTSIQDGSISVEDNDHHLSRRAAPSNNNNIYPIESLIQWLTERQYQYEIAYYALASNNVFPNFAKLFHERSEEKYVIEFLRKNHFVFSRYDDIKGLIRLCQILNLDINLQFISSSGVNRPLGLLSPEYINKTNFAQFFSDLKSDECDRSFTKFFKVYEQMINMSIPLQMYLKEKVFMKQILICKLTSDLYIQLHRFIETDSNDRSIPFSLMFFDSRAEFM